MPPEFDCIVAGAGLVGSTTALALAESGHRVHVVEQREPQGEDAPEARALVLSPASVAVFERLGLWPDLKARSTDLQTIVVRERGRFGSVHLHAGDFELDALGWACPARYLLASLHREIQQNPRISISWSTRLGALSLAEAASVSVHLEAHGDTHRISARLLAGADGGESTVRDLSGIGVDTVDYGQQAIVARVRAQRPQPHTAFEIFTCDGPLALIPCGGDELVAVQCLGEAHAAHALDLDDEAYADMLEQRSGSRLGAFTLLGPRRPHTLHWTGAKRLVAARTVLIGNAAQSVHPNAAQGLNLGLRDVASLADHLRGIDDIGASEVLDTYHTSRRPDHRQVGRITHLLAQGFTSRLTTARCLRHAGMQLLSAAPPLRRELVRRLSGLAMLAPAVEAS